MNDHQLAEVQWYRVHGAHQDRVATDSSGNPYVIGDDSWNSQHPNRRESVERIMAAAVRRMMEP